MVKETHARVQQILWELEGSHIPEEFPKTNHQPHTQAEEAWTREGAAANTPWGRTCPGAAARPLGTQSENQTLTTTSHIWPLLKLSGLKILGQKPKAKSSFKTQPLGNGTSSVAPDRRRPSVRVVGCQ